jgi:hypothetical protein
MKTDTELREEINKMGGDEVAQRLVSIMQDDPIGFLLAIDERIMSVCSQYRDGIKERLNDKINNVVGRHVHSNSGAACLPMVEDTKQCDQPYMSETISNSPYSVLNEIVHLVHRGHNARMQSEATPEQEKE